MFITMEGDAKMKRLIIEWRHLDVEGETCDRCYDTGENLANEVKRLNRVLQSKGIEVEWIETKLNDSQIPQSNTLFFNGVPIEDILQIEVSENFCDSCTALLGKKPAAGRSGLTAMGMKTFPPKRFVRRR
jgi:hypothetical protein